jgi:DNA polymerase-3 subunit delta'
MAQERIPHAYLFTGIGGIGKKLTALAFAGALNCHEPVEGDACGRCLSCRQMKNGNFPDFIHLRPDGQNIKIDQVRDVIRALAFRPVSGRFRVTVIEAGESMTEEAANAFLKVLEEPPPGNILVLIASEPLDLLPTIVSRCQQVPFSPLPVALIEENLAAGKGMEREKAEVLARLSDGSPGRALEMSASGFLEKRQDYLQDFLRLPGLSGEQALEMALEYSRGSRKKASRESAKGEGPISDLLGMWKTWYRDLLLMKVGGPEGLLINIDFSHKLKSLSRAFTVDALVHGLLTLNRAERDLTRSRNLDLLMENTLLTLRGLGGSPGGAERAPVNP